MPRRTEAGVMIFPLAVLVIALRLGRAVMTVFLRPVCFDFFFLLAAFDLATADAGVNAALALVFAAWTLAALLAEVAGATFGLL